MTVVDALHYLPPQELRFQLWHLTIRFHLEVAVQAATVDILHDQEDLLRRLECFVQLCDVWVIKFLHDLHLALDAFLAIWLDQFDFLVNLHCDLLVKLFVKPEPHNCIGSLADSFADDVAFNVVIRSIGCAKFYLIGVLGCTST
jgi:hypothetical protein